MNRADGTRNLRRFDLSDWLVHFTREVPQNSNEVPLPDEWPLGTLVETDEPLPPFFMLRQILRELRIIPTWSFRGGRRTIYGPRPAVCLTAMPLAAFLMSGSERERRKEKMSPLGIVFPKSQMFERGARPAIYGVAEGEEAGSRIKNGGPRVLKGDSFSEAEHFRYVAFDPAKNGTLDWTHEREWRWPATTNIPRVTSFEGLSSHALDLSVFRGMGFVVETEHQSKLLVHDILKMVDSGVITSETFAFIMIGEHFPDPRKLILPEQTDEALAASTIDLAPFFNQNEEETVDLFRRFDGVLDRFMSSTKLDRSPGELGWCYLWLRDNTHPLVRAFVANPHLRGYEIDPDGRYLVEIPEFGDDTGLRFRENLMKSLAEMVHAEFATPASYFSILYGWGGMTPSYTDVDVTDEVYFNLPRKSV